MRSALRLLSVMGPALGLAILPATRVSGLQAAQNQVQQQYQAAVQQTVTHPFRVEIQPPPQAVKQGSAAVLKIQLRNANNELINATEKMSFEVKTSLPSKGSQTYRVEIAPGSSAGAVTVQANEPGLWKLEVHESNEHLISGSNYLQVAAPATSKPLMKKAAPKKSSRPATTPGSALMFAPRLVLAAYAQPGPRSSASTPDPPAPSEVVLTVSGEGDGKVRADGKTAATVSVFLLAAQASDVRIWLQVSQGQLASPVITIKQGDTRGDVGWTSATPASQAKVWIANASPQIAGQESASATVEFIDPIVAIAFANPPAKMNIVELGTLAVRFVDGHAQPVATHMPYSYTFNADSAHVHLTPLADQTKPGDIDFKTSITPAAFGPVTIEAAVPGLQPVRQSIEVTGALLLLLCVIGGAFGGLVNHLDRKQKGLAASLVTGMVIALPMTWLYVWVGLPHINAAILHNQFSAVMVAIIAGVAGAGSLKKASELAGLSLFEPAKPAASAKGAGG